MPKTKRDPHSFYENSGIRHLLPFLVFGVGGGGLAVVLDVYFSLERLGLLLVILMIAPLAFYIYKKLETPPEEEAEMERMRAERYKNNQ